MFRSLVGNLILHESIETTQPKAKAIKGLVDTLISKSKQKSSSSLSSVESFLVQPALIKKLTSEIAPRYSDRVSGFTTTVRLGRRLGDGAMMVKMSLVEGKVPQGEKASRVPQGEEDKNESNSTEAPRDTRATRSTRGTSKRGSK